MAKAFGKPMRHAMLLFAFGFGAIAQAGVAGVLPHSGGLTCSMIAVASPRVTQAPSILAEAKPAQSHQAGDHESDLTHEMMILVLQLALIIIAARIGGELFERFLKQPAVLGELAAGMLIGPYALGPHLAFFGLDPLFPHILDGFPVSPSLYGIASIASIILLFKVGLETDFNQFLRYAGPGFAIGAAGVAGAFITGDLIYIAFYGGAFMDPAALFMGAVSTATSVGITARVLSEKRKLDSPEGTTILASAVIDDVLGILILAVTAGIAAAGAKGGAVAWGHIGIIALKAFGFWLVATLSGIFLASRIAKTIDWFRTSGATVALGFGLSLLLAGIAEAFGMAMIIGAYIMGLSLSKEHISHRIEQALGPVSACLVPIFFAVMGMLVDFKAMTGAFWFGLLYSAVAVVSKTLACVLPSLLVGFNSLGAWRIGIGMLPRGEVALIIAGVGLSQSFIGREMFGVVIMMTLITTVTAPPILVHLFKKAGHGTRVPQPALSLSEKLLYFEKLTWDNHGLLMSCINQAFNERGFSFKLLNQEKRLYQILGTIDGQDVITLLQDFNDRLEFNTSKQNHELIKLIVQKAHEDAKNRINRLELKETDL